MAVLWNQVRLWVCLEHQAGQTIEQSWSIDAICHLELGSFTRHMNTGR